VFSPTITQKQLFLSRLGPKTNEFAAYKPLFLLTNPLRQDTLHKDFILSIAHSGERLPTTNEDSTVRCAAIGATPLGKQAIARRNEERIRNSEGSQDSK